jgi:hypothetical protein
MIGDWHQVIDDIFHLVPFTSYDVTNCIKHLLFDRRIPDAGGGVGEVPVYRDVLS